MEPPSRVSRDSGQICPNCGIFSGSLSVNHGQDLQVTFRALGVDVACKLVCGLDTRTWNYSERLGVGQGPRMTLPPKGAPNTMGGRSHSQTYLHLCLHPACLTCQDPVFSQEQPALGPRVVIGAVITGRCLQQQVLAAKGRFPACETWKVRPCRTVWGSLGSGPGRRPLEKPAAHCV